MLYEVVKRGQPYNQLTKALKKNISIKKKLLSLLYVQSNIYETVPADQIKKP